MVASICIIRLKALCLLLVIEWKLVYVLIFGLSVD